MPQAIKIIPENDEIIREVADVVVMDINEFPGLRYLVWDIGDPVVNWAMMPSEQFHEQWEFLGSEVEGDFAAVKPKER